MLDDEEPLSMNEAECQEIPPVILIDVLDETLANKEWVQSIFDTLGDNIYNPIIEWDVCNAYWPQKNKDQNGLMRMTFPVVAFEATHDLQNLHEISN